MKRNKRLKKHHAAHIKYILSGWGIVVSILLAAVTIFYYLDLYFGGHSGVVQHDAGKFLQSLERRIGWEGDVPVLSDTSEQDYEGVSYAIIHRESERVIESTLPKDIPISTFTQAKEPTLDYQSGSNHYYIRIKGISKRIHPRTTGSNVPRRENKDTYILCALVDYSEINTIYYDVRAFSIILILVLILCLIAISVIVNHIITRHLSKLTSQAETMIQTHNYDLSFDTKGPFIEINILADSYNQLLKQVNSSMQRQLRFNRDVSHELRTPITILKAQCQISKEQFEHEPDALKAITVIERQTERINNMTQQLHELARLDQSQVFDHTEIVDLDDVIRSICEDISFVKNDRIHFSLLLERIRIRANTGLMLVLVRNLIENAVKYSPEAEPVTVSLHRLNDTVTICVQDHGVGMSDEVREHVFEAFYRADNARSTEGFGLGLTMVKRIVDLYHGDIQIESTEGEGSTFTVLSPKQKR